jgi:hypothetical protein
MQENYKKYLFSVDLYVESAILALLVVSIEPLPFDQGTVSLYELMVGQNVLCLIIYLSNMFQTYANTHTQTHTLAYTDSHTRVPIILVQCKPLKSF